MKEGYIIEQYGVDDFDMIIINNYLPINKVSFIQWRSKELSLISAYTVAVFRIKPKK